MTRTLEVRRHARRDPDADRLSPEGRAQAEDVGRTLAGGYDVVFVSPAQRAAETVAWFLRGRGEQLPRHGVIPGLAGEGTDRSPLAMAGVLAALLDAVPEGGRGLAVGHTPLIERAVLGLIAQDIEPLAECEGVALTREGDEGPIRVDQLRLRTAG
ncbi:MAG TPA: histidine phosphatase family protein [Actinomycetota bacterium]|nr:histidine phosphatase family protein [Actinomycetota bacterium]